MHELKREEQNINRLTMTIAADLGRIATKQTNKQTKEQNI